MSKSLFERTSLKLGSNSQYDKSKSRLISDPDIYIFLEKVIRDGVSFIFNRYSKAKNNYFKSYDPKQDSRHIYLSENNYHGYETSKFFSSSGFKWIDSKEIGLREYTSNSSEGCLLEVGLEYPKKLQELHNDYPLAPNKIEINRELLSEYQLKIAYLYDIPIGNVKKLMPNAFDKEKYVIYYENVKLYLRLGLKQKK